MKLETPFKISLIITVILIVLSLIFFQKITPEIPLFYSLADSGSQLVPKGWIFLLPVLSLLINVVHLGLTKIFNQINPFVLKLFIWTTLFLQVILFIVNVRIIAIIS